MRQKTTKKPAKRHPSKVAPLAWNALPHQELLRSARESMLFGSRSRAGEEARIHILSRRLPRLDAAEHMKYIEIASTRMVEMLRAVRDTYRTYLKEQGAKPLAEMYWVVCQYGVKDWAVMLLRDVVFGYIGACQIRTEDWDALFGLPLTKGLSPGETGNRALTPTLNADRALWKRVNELVDENVFDEVIAGGPFGRISQMRLAQSVYGLLFSTGSDTLPQLIKNREDRWDKCCPWTEGLAMLFDAAQGEVIFQFDALGDDGRRAESLLLALSPLQRIVYKHLSDLRQGRATERWGEAVWLPLFSELDERGVPLDELTNTAKAVLTSVRKQRKKVETWVDCYKSNGNALLDDGKRHTLKREVCHAMHNELRAATSQLARIYPMPKKS